MAFTEQAHVGDIGTTFRVTVYDLSSTGTTSAADISDATDKKFIFSRPDRTSFERTADFVTDGSDGKIQYVVVSGDLDTAGTWHLQARVTSSGGTWNTDSVCFRVYENL